MTRTRMTRSGMTRLSDATVAHLVDVVERPDAGERYVIHEVLGRGGMGTVYRATDQVLGREVALKVLTLAAETASLTERLAREARVLARLEHPGIVAVHDAGTLADGRPYYVMRLVRGRSLRDAVPFDSIGALLRRFLQVCDAVAFAHARGVVHRDLTPSNVMMGEYGDVLVVDWGVAKLAGVPGAWAAGEADHAPPSDSDAARAPEAEPSTGLTTGAGVVVGTPGFMAPEQARGAGQDVDVRTDVYGLGALLADLLRRQDKPIPPPLGAIVRHAMAMDPDARYPSVPSLADDVRQWLDGERVQAHRERPWERLHRGYRRHRTLVWLLAGYAAVRVGIFAWRGV